MSTQFTLLDALMEIEKNLKREKYDLGVIWRKMCHRLKNWFITCAGTIYQAEATFLGGWGAFIFPTGTEEILSTSL